MVKKEHRFRGVLEAARIFKAIVDAIFASGGSEEDVARLEVLAPQIAKLCIAARPLPPKKAKVQPAAKSKEVVEELGWIELDPAISLAERRRRGDYQGGFHPNITADNSRLQRKVRRLIVLYDPQDDVSTEEMIRRIREDGKRPCDVDDGLGIGITYPQRQVLNPLAFLDESAVCLGHDGSLCVPVLNTLKGKRGFALGPQAGDWPNNFRFPAVSREEFLDG
jgi:hypothetical protein